jgi:hypothetical protein
VSERGACLFEAYGPTLGPIAPSSHSGGWALYLVLVRLVRGISKDLDVVYGESVEQRHVADQENGDHEVTDHEEHGRGANLHVHYSGSALRPSLRLIASTYLLLQS